MPLATIDRDVPDSPSGTNDHLPRAVLSATEAQVRGVVMLFPIALLSLGPHFTLWGLPDVPFPTTLSSALLFIGAFVLGTILHEVLHGVGHAWGEASWEDVRFGMHWKALTPFASCTVPTRVGSYRIAIALPALVLGGLPLAVGLTTGYWLATFYGFLMLVAAAGDILMLWILRVVPAGTWVQDHPREVGYVIVAGASVSTPPSVSEEELVEPSDGEDGISLREVAVLSAIPLACMVTGLLLAFLLA